jgi:hypothetical protein
MFKIEPLKVEKNPNLPEKQKDTFTLEKKGVIKFIIKDIKEYMFKVKSDNNKYLIKKEDDKKHITVEPVIINKSDFIFKPKNNEKPVQKPKETKKLRSVKVKNKVYETGKSLEIKLDKVNQDKFKKELIKTSNVNPTNNTQRERKGICSLFLCKLSSLY